MGSGFLVCAPLLFANIGNYAVFAMGGLLCLAYAVGAVIRFNIRYGEALFEKRNLPIDISREEHRLHIGHRNVAYKVNTEETMEILEKASHIALAGAYCISVSYIYNYLRVLPFTPFLLTRCGMVEKYWSLSFWQESALLALHED